MIRGGLAPLIPRNRPVLSVGFRADTGHVMWFEYSVRRNIGPSGHRVPARPAARQVTVVI